jgi:hypothetical protein
VHPLAEIAEDVLAAPEPAPPPGGFLVGRSREGREIQGWVLGRGERRVSLIAGCHADEPVGPAMLRRLLARLATLPAEHPLLAGATWYVVPHVNPDGEARNAAWSGRTLPARDHRGAADRACDLAAYLAGAVREPPGDDMEFGFPRDPGDLGARPENRAVADFLAAGAPFALHASFHGIAFAPGPWFLLEEAWIGRTEELRRTLRERVRAMGYRPFDVDRGGEKGFRRIDEGFTTRPDSRAMQEHFRAQGDAARAALFRPSSMEHVRSLGGDPLTLVSEMPLFLRPPLPREIGPAGEGELRAWLARLATLRDPAEVYAEAGRRGVLPMPLRDQMRLQLAFLATALAAVEGGGGPTRRPAEGRA